MSVLISAGSLYARSIAANSAFSSSGVKLIASAGLDQHAQEEVQKVQVLVGGFQREGIDGEAGVLQPDVQVCAAEDARQRFVAAAQVEDEGQRLILLQRLQDGKPAVNDLPAPVAPSSSVWATSPECKIHVVRRAMRRFEDGEILAFEMRVPPRAAIDGKQERQVGVIGVECPLLAKVELLVAGHRGEERIQQVVAFLIQQAVMLGEQLLELRDGMFHLHAVLVVDHDRQRELTEVLALHAHRGQRAAKLRDGGLLGVIDQFILWAGVLPVLKIRDEAGLRVMVMAAATGDFLPRLRVIDWMPFGDDMEVRRDVEQAIEEQGPRLAGQFFQREDADIVVVHAQITAMRLQLRIAYLPVEMPRTV